MFSVDREIDYCVTIVQRCMFIFILFFYLPTVSIFFLLCSGSTRCTAFLGGCCCLLSCRGFGCDFQEVKIILFSVAFPNFFFFSCFKALFLLLPLPNKSSSTPGVIELVDYCDSLWTRQQHISNNQRTNDY